MEAGKPRNPDSEYHDTAHIRLRRRGPGWRDEESEQVEGTGSEESRFRADPSSSAQHALPRGDSTLQLPHPTLRSGRLSHAVHPRVPFISEVGTAAPLHRCRRFWLRLAWQRGVPEHIVGPTIPPLRIHRVSQAPAGEKRES